MLMNPYLIFGLSLFILVIGLAEVLVGYVKKAYSEKSNGILTFWGFLHIVFSMIPMVAMARIIATEDQPTLSTPFRIFLAIYMLLLGLMTIVPLERVIREEKL
ncbi:hypothetical protein [Nocardia transvalensis]|uniref:hypothetical protein n=1 Tax=Nocardia transvalensis TaxID=37333 RepID=UPI001896139C|nr:hypothetical protein [Nocardia transvalensis]MBF6332335.1 hypothetical protein [Nocardia transvalensis]